MNPTRTRPWNTKRKRQVLTTSLTPTRTAKYTVTYKLRDKMVKSVPIKTNIRRKAPQCFHGTFIIILVFRPPSRRYFLASARNCNARNRISSVRRTSNATHKSYRPVITAEQRPISAVIRRVSHFSTRENFALALGISSRVMDN